MISKAKGQLVVARGNNVNRRSGGGSGHNSHQIPANQPASTLKQNKVVTYIIENMLTSNNLLHRHWMMVTMEIEKKERKGEGPVNQPLCILFAPTLLSELVDFSRSSLSVPVV